MNVSPNMHSLLIHAAGRNRRRECASLVIPSDTSGIHILAVLETTKISAEVAIRSPTPTAAPSTATIVGEGCFCIAATHFRAASSTVSGSIGEDLMSKPAENMELPPRSKTGRGSLADRSKTDARVWNISAVNALTGGLSMRIRIASSLWLASTPSTQQAESVALRPDGSTSPGSRTSVGRYELPSAPVCNAHPLLAVAPSGFSEHVGGADTYGRVLRAMGVRLLRRAYGFETSDWHTERAAVDAVEPDPGINANSAKVVAGFIMCAKLELQGS